MRLILGMSWTAVLVFHAHALALLPSAQTHDLLWKRESRTFAPQCSLSCLATLVPQYCGSSTNETCLCTSKPFATAIQPCTSAACNITEGLQLQRYIAESCNVSNDKGRLQMLWLLTYTFPAIVVVFVAIRILIRIKLNFGLGADDWMLLAAFAAFLLSISGVIVMLYDKFGLHTFWLSASQISYGLKWFYISEISYIFVVTFTKLSLLLFYLRIFHDAQFRNLVWIIFVTVSLAGFSLVIACALQCIPIYGAWTNWMYKERPIKCVNNFTAAYTGAGIGIILDIIIISLPLPRLWKLNLSWSKKLNLFIMFSLGSFVVVCSLFRLPTILKLGTSFDPSWDQTLIMLWSILEQGMGIICACLPACRSFVGYLFPGQKSTPDTSGTGTRSHINGSKSCTKRESALGREFVELETRSENQSHSDRMMEDRRSRETENSETPMEDKSVPHDRKNGFGCEVKVDVEDMNIELRDVSGTSSTVTKTVSRLEHRQ